MLNSNAESLEIILIGNIKDIKATVVNKTNDCFPTSFFDIIYQFAEEKVLAQGGFVACKNELFARSGYGNVQFAVNRLAVFDERIGSEKFQLEAVLNGERIDNDVALATLIAFHRVDAYLVDSGQMKLFQLFSYHRNLVSVGHNDANRLLCIERRAHWRYRRRTRSATMRASSVFTFSEM